jgi:hypothetical protein
MDVSDRPFHRKLRRSGSTCVPSSVAKKQSCPHHEAQGSEGGSSECRPEMTLFIIYDRGFPRKGSKLEISQIQSSEGKKSRIQALSR